MPPVLIQPDAPYGGAAYGSLTFSSGPNIAIHSSTPAVASSTGSSATSPSFSPPAGSLLLVGLSNCSLSSSGHGITSITDSLGTHLNYTRLITGTNPYGTPEIWVADVPSTAPGSMTITASWPVNNVVLTVLVLTGASKVAQQTGATGSYGVYNQNGGTVTAASLTVANSSWVFSMATNNWSGSSPTFPGTETDVFNGNTMFAAPNGYGNWLYGFTGPSSAGSVTLTFTAVGQFIGNGVEAEIKVAPTGAFPQTIIPTGIASAEAFGTQRIAFSKTVAPSGIPSAEAVGTHDIVIRGAPIHPSGVVTAEGWGKPHVQRLRTTTAVITPTGIVSAEAFGTATVHPGVHTIFPVGIPGAEAFGLQGIGRPVILPRPTGTGPIPLMLVRRIGIRH